MAAAARGGTTECNDLINIFDVTRSLDQLLTSD